MEYIIKGVEESINDYEYKYNPNDPVLATRERATAALVSSIQWLSGHYCVNDEKRIKMIDILKSESVSDADKLQALGYLILESDSICVKERPKNVDGDL